MKVTQILALLVFEDAQEVTRIHLKMRAKTFGHERHEPLEVAELVDCLDDLRILNSLQVLLQFAGERLSKALLELAQLLVESLQLRVIFALKKASFLLVSEWATLSVDLILLPLFGSFFHRHCQLACTVQELAVDDHLYDERIAALFDRIQMLEDVLLLRRGC